MMSKRRNTAFCYIDSVIVGVDLKMFYEEEKRK